MNPSEPSTPRCAILVPLAVAMCAASDWSTPEARFVSACIVCGTLATMAAVCMVWRVRTALRSDSDEYGGVRLPEASGGWRSAASGQWTTEA